MKYLFAIFSFLILPSAFAIDLAWNFTGEMHGPRWLETLSLLPEGRVLAVGGDDASGRALRTCEIYDAATGTWTAAASMEVARERHTATTLSDGRIVVIGGNPTTIFVYDNQTSSIEIYDPSSGTWTDGGNLNVPRQDHTATLLPNGLILVAGGWGPGRCLSSCELYNPVTHTAISIAPLLQERYDHQAALLNSGEVLVAGGRIGGWDGTYLNACELYDASTNKWRRIDPMHQARVIGSLQTFSDGTVLAAGGRNTPTSIAPGAELLEPGATTWRSVCPMNQGRSWQGDIHLPFDRYLVTGGLIDANWSSNNSVVATASCEWYEKILGVWFCAPSLEQPRSKHAALLLQQEVNRSLPRLLLLVAGGITGDHTYTATTEYLDFTDDAVSFYEAHQPAPLGIAPSESVRPMGLEVLANPGPSPLATLSVNKPGIVKFELVSPQGVVVAQQVQEVDSRATVSATLGNSSLANGVYLLRATAAGHSETKKISVLR